METLKKLEQEEYDNIDFRKFNIYEFPNSVFRLDDKRLIVCYIYRPISQFEDDPLPYGCNTHTHIMSLINLTTGRCAQIDFFCSNRRDSYSKRFKSNEEWCVHCLKEGKIKL